MKKKLTDEEIIKALKFAIAQGEPDGIGFWNNRMKWCEFSMCDVLDLIQQQKAEIERLTEEKYKVEQNLKECENGYELELHTARFDMQMNRGRVAELQKQVDELKERSKLDLENEKKWGKLLKEQAVKEAVKDTAKEILDELENIKQYAKDFYGLNEKVGVDIAINTMKTVLQRKGVEVE